MTKKIKVVYNIVLDSDKFREPQNIRRKEGTRFLRLGRSRDKIIPRHDSIILNAGIKVTLDVIEVIQNAGIRVTLKSL